MNDDSFDLRAAALRLKKKEQKLNEELKKRRRAAQQEGRSAARVAASGDKSIDRIIGFGSTYETWRNYRIDSDIDLAVIGGNPNKYPVEVHENGFDLTFILLDEQSEKFSEMVLKNGVVLYEK